MIVILDWPPKELNPNKRLHWTKVAKAKRAYRAQGFIQTVNAMNHYQEKISDKPSVHIEFSPPDRRKRDWDNMLASMKAGLDGIADALGIDDNHFKISFEVIEARTGLVRVIIK